MSAVYLSCKLAKFLKDNRERHQMQLHKRIYFLQISDGLYYNAALTLSILQKLGVASEIFNLWFQMLQEVKKSGVRANFKRSASLLFTVPPPCLNYLLHTLFSLCNISYCV